jgi:hypothetical protein
MPNRILRDWTDSETVSTIPMGAEVLFVRLIMKADDYGRLPGNPKLLRSTLFPLRDEVSVQDVTDWLGDLESAGLVTLYVVDGKQFVEIRKFKQKPRSASKYPQPDSSCAQPASKCAPYSNANSNPNANAEAHSNANANANAEAVQASPVSAGEKNPESDSASDSDSGHKGVQRVAATQLCETFGVKPVGPNDKSAFAQQQRADMRTLASIVQQVIRSTDSVKAKAEKLALFKAADQCFGPGLQKPIAKFVNVVKEQFPWVTFKHGSGP